MAAAVNLKRKNIDLPVETLQKLSMMAIAQGKSLKKYIESLLISKAETINVEVTENPSPSGDPWFNDSENLAMVQEGIAQYKEGKTVSYTDEELKAILGV